MTPAVPMDRNERVVGRVVAVEHDFADQDMSDPLLGSGVGARCIPCRRQVSARSLRKRVTTPPWPPVATKWSIRPSVWSRANSRPGGTRRWSGSPISRDRIARHDVAAALRPKADRAALMALARVQDRVAAGGLPHGAADPE